MQELEIQLPKPEIILVDTTVEEVYNALKKNGFQHLREEWWDGTGGCVLMQTAWNLGVIANSSGAGGASLPFDKYGEIAKGWRQISKKYDKYALDVQLNKWKITDGNKWYDEDEFDTVEVGIGDTIIHWNDKRDPEKEGSTFYALPTYDDVADMAYDLLSPYFSKTVKLLKYEYTNLPKVS